MSEHVLVGNVERFGIESDGPSHRFSTILAESYHYARLRIKELEEIVACYEAMKEGVAVRIADLNHTNATLSLKARVVDRLPLCPDHRDKVAGKSCLQCEVERLRSIMQKFLESRLSLEKATHGMSEGQLLPQSAIVFRDEMREAVRAMASEAAKGSGES